MQLTSIKCQPREFWSLQVKVSDSLLFYTINWWIERAKRMAHQDVNAWRRRLNIPECPAHAHFYTAEFQLNYAWVCNNRLNCSLWDSKMSDCIEFRLDKVSHLMRLWHFHSSVKSFFKMPPSGLDIWFLVRSFVYFHSSLVRTVTALLAWPFTGCLCDKYHNLLSRLKWFI